MLRAFLRVHVRLVDGDPSPLTRAIGELVDRVPDDRAQLGSIVKAAEGAPIIEGQTNHGVERQDGAFVFVRLAGPFAPEEERRTDGPIRYEVRAEEILLDELGTGEGVPDLCAGTFDDDGGGRRVRHVPDDGSFAPRGRVAPVRYPARGGGAAGAAAATGRGGAGTAVGERPGCRHEEPIVRTARPHPTTKNQAESPLAPAVGFWGPRERPA